MGQWLTLLSFTTPEGLAKPVQEKGQDRGPGRVLEFALSQIQGVGIG